MKKRVLSLILTVVMLLGAMPFCASAESAQINEISFEFDSQSAVGKKFSEYAEFVTLLSPNMHFETNPVYSSLIFFDAVTGDQVIDKIVEGKEYGVCLKIYPEDGYSFSYDCQIAINGKKLIQYSQYELTFEENTDAITIMFGIIAGKELEFKKIDSVSLGFDSVACAGKTPNDYIDLVTLNSENLSFVDYKADVNGNGSNEKLQVLNVYKSDGTALAPGEVMQAGTEYKAYIYLMADFGYYMVASELKNKIEINDGSDCLTSYGVGVGRNGRNFLSVGFRFVAGEPLEQNFFDMILQRIVEFFEELFDRILEIFR